MRKIIAFTSFLFLLLLAVLPVQATHAAAAANDTAPVIKGISLVKPDNSEIKSTQNGDSFSFDLYKLDGAQEIKEFRFNSDTATKVSLVPNSVADVNSEINLDDFDIQFVNGVATLDKDKFNNWLNRQLAYGNAELTPEELQQLQENVNSLFTVQGLRDTFESGQEIPLFVYDANGNESQVSVTFNHGWKLEKGLGWVFYGNNGQLTKGWYYDELNEVWYYLDPTSGVMKTGWVLYNKKWYFLNASGEMATDWILDKGKYYYLDSETGAMKTGWLYDEGNWYFLDKNSGAMKTGWVKDGGKWYFLNKTGEMVTGWVYDNSRWYYLKSPSGSMATGWLYVGGKWYYLYSDGHMAKNTKIGSYRLGTDGAWIH